MSILVCVAPLWRARLLPVLFAAAVSAWLAVSATAQNPRGALRGEVQDLSGARISGAQVEAKSKGSSRVSAIDTDRNGEFRMEGLLPGSYVVTVSAEGFASVNADVEVVVSMVRDVSVTLKPLTRPESVSVE